MFGSRPRDRRACKSRLASAKRPRWRLAGSRDGRHDEHHGGCTAVTWSFRAKGIGVDTLGDDLESTDAIDFITKLKLSSELDRLVAAFREYHDGSGRHRLPALYGRFDRLLETTLALTEDNDPMLYRKLKRSRSKLWQILVDREEFHVTMEQTDVALRKSSIRH